MSYQNGLKFRSFIEFWEYLNPEERMVTDVLRQIVIGQLPSAIEKLTNNVPYYFGKKRICLIWPASIPGGGVRKGVLFGFCKGNQLRDQHHYLDHGKNKRIFYKIFQSVDQIDYDALVSLLNEAMEVDRQFAS
jgi:hypothetical protein